jgi:hypothetical protein
MRPVRSGYAQRFPHLARRRPAQPVQRAYDFTRICVGSEYGSGQPVYLDDTVRREGMHIIGAPGGGKTTLVKAIALSDFKRGYGGLVTDPNGSHPGSLYSEILIELDRLGFLRSGRVHIIDPNLHEAAGYIIPINPLARRHALHTSVSADSLLQAVERVWDDEETHAKPTIRRRLKMLFMALAELGLPLTDAKYFLDPHDRHGVRARAIQALSNEFSRDALEELHQIAIDDRSKRDFRIECLGSFNRLAEFLSSDAISAMFGVVDEPGKTPRTLDLLACMEAGDIILVNLQPGLAISEADADLLGAILLRYVFLLSQLRQNREAFGIYVDEAHRLLTGDVPSLLATGRKYGLMPVLIHQFMAQAGKPDDLMYQALLACMEIQAIFRVKDPREAQLLAEHVLPLNLERPVAASVRPTVVAQRRVWLSSRAKSASKGESEGEGETRGTMHAITSAETTGETVASIASTTTGAGQFDALGQSSGVVMQPAYQMFGPNAPGASMWPAPLSESTGTNNVHGASSMSAETRGEVRGSIRAYTEAETVARSRATSTSRARNRATSEMTGESEGFENVFQNLPSAWHSLDAERYRAGEVIRALPTGRCFLSFRGRTVCLDVPKAKRES